MVARTQPRQPRGDPQDLRPAVGLLHPRQPRPLDAEPGDGERAGRQWRAAGAAPTSAEGQVKAADYFLEPDIVSTNKNSGGGGIGAALGGAIGGLFGGSAGSVIGGIAGGINVKKGEANVTLSLVNARTTEEEALTEGYFRKRDLSFAGAGGGAGWWGGFGAAGGGGYQNTEIGQIIVLAYLDAYKKLVTQLGGAAGDGAGAVGGP